MKCWHRCLFLKEEVYTQLAMMCRSYDLTPKARRGVPLNSRGRDVHILSKVGDPPSLTDPFLQKVILSHYHNYFNGLLVKVEAFRML